MTGVNIKARVVGVRPREDGSFGITLGPGPEVIYWFITRDPPKLGELVEIDNAELYQTELKTNIGKSLVTIIEGGKMKVFSDRFARRVVAKEWMVRSCSVMKRPLYPYQIEGAGWLASRLAAGRGAILGDDPGLGKTSQVIAALGATLAFPVIVVCPSSVKKNWEREFRYLRADLTIKILYGSKGKISKANVIIVNYDVLKQREAQLSMVGARTIVFDEGHALKEPSPSASHRAAVATRIAHRIGRAIITTGTPILNRPSELWRLLHIVDPKSWKSFLNFKERYCVNPTDEIEEVSKLVTEHGQVVRLEELSAFVEPLMLRRIKSHVLQDLPEKSRRSVLVELEEFDRKNYEQAEKDVIKWLDAIGSSARARAAARGQAVVKLTMLRRIAAIGKLRKAVREYLESWFDRNESAPLVIFAYHKEVVSGVKIICDRIGARVCGISGATKEKDRNEAVERFQSGGADVFIGSIQAAGQGINLQRASDVLILERMWTPALMTQAEDRCHRIGQSRPVSVTYMDADNTVDTYIAEVIESKQRLIDGAIDGVVDEDSAKKQEIRTIEEVIEKIRNK